MHEKLTINKNMKHKLIAVDMDGTLLNSKGLITDGTLSSIRKIVDEGVIFTVATGRPVQGVEKYNTLLQLKGPVVTYNGAVVIDVETHEVLFERGLIREDSEKILELGEKYDVTMCIWSNNQLYGNKMNDRIHEYKKISGVEPLPADYNKLLEQGITKILWYDEPERIDEILGELSEDMFSEVTLCKSQPVFLELFNKNVSKAEAIKKIGEYYGIKQEETIAIGDEINDLSMIEYAGLGVAMGNAKEEVKKIANYITSSNDEDGVRKVIEVYFYE